MALEGLKNRILSSVGLLSGKREADEEAIRELTKSLRRALLEADFNVRQAKELTERIERRLLEEQPRPGVRLDTHAMNLIYTELVRLRDEGKCRFIGMTGYPLHTMRRAVTETDLDVVLNYAHFTLLNTELSEGLLPEADRNGTAVINAAAVALGLLTPGGLKADVPASAAMRSAADRARAICERRGVDISFLANQFAIQRSSCPTTLIGTTKAHHLDSAVRAADTPIDEDLLTEVLAATAAVHGESWPSGLPENN